MTRPIDLFVLFATIGSCLAVSELFLDQDDQIVDNLKLDQVIKQPRVSSSESIDISKSIDSRKKTTPLKTDGKKCQEIRVPMCRNMPYNMTSMPNQFGHETQQEAAMEAHQFWALVEINCAKELRFFLCSMYTPICLNDYPKPIRACRSVCERARLGCEKYMKKFGFDWPEHMNCENFPESPSHATSRLDATSEVCMDPLDMEIQRTQLVLNHEPTQSSEQKEVTIWPGVDLNQLVNKTKQCPKPLVASKRHECVHPCQGVHFQQKWQREFVKYWILAFTVLCLVSTSCTMFTFLADRKRFVFYPQRAVAFISLCYFFIACGYMIRFIVGRDELVCNRLDMTLTTSIDSLFSYCTLQFVLIYFFGMASCVWWVVVSLSWYLTAGRKWSMQSVNTYSFWYHLVAWVLPGAQTVSVLVYRGVDGDSLAGICSVGNSDVNTLKWFVIIPQSIYLIVGAGFLLAGFVKMMKLVRDKDSVLDSTVNVIEKKTRRPPIVDECDSNLDFKSERKSIKKRRRLERLMLRIGIFAILFTVPQTCLIACQLYENIFRDSWDQSVLECSSRANCDQKYQPDFYVFMLKYFMSLFIGITGAFWICSSKTLNTWSSSTLFKSKQSLDELPTRNNSSLASQYSSSSKKMNQRKEDFKNNQELVFMMENEQDKQDGGFQQYQQQVPINLKFFSTMNPSPTYQYPIATHLNGPPRLHSYHTSSDLKQYDLFTRAHQNPDLLYEYSTAAPMNTNNGHTSANSTTSTASTTVLSHHMPNVFNLNYKRV